MAELKHILAATDLSAPARHAVERAALVAAGNDAALAMIHIANLAPLDQIRQLLSSEPERLEQDLVDQLRESLRTLGASIHERFGITPALRVATGDLLPELLNHAATLPADLLVLGARGSSFLRHILLGTTAERLLSSSRFPMLVVKQPPHEPYRQLLVPVDFSPSSLRALRLARTIAPRADITVLHVFEVPFEGQLRYAGVDDSKIEHYRAIAHNQAWEKLRQLRTSAELDDARVELLVRQGDVSQRIIEQEQEADCDLIVIGKHGKDAIEELLLGRVTRHVLTESQGDILVSL
jgi:nucleotide-binding universal stress UspA family protein